MLLPPFVYLCNRKAKLKFKLSKYEVGPFSYSFGANSVDAGGDMRIGKAVTTSPSVEAKRVQL
jgi:hypothetical protein